jgi:hypothetical protein
MTWVHAGVIGLRPYTISVTSTFRVGGPGEPETQVHVFCDASEKAYGAVLYIRSTHETETSVQIVCSKNRLTPLKKVSLPRLELIAALIGAPLLHYFCKATRHSISEATLWSDSAVTLGWIRNDPNRWTTFIANRVTKIQTYTTSSQWKHCPGEDNPADHLSRGVSAEVFKELKDWWHGPSWLSQDPNHWTGQPTRPHHTFPEGRNQSILVGPTASPGRLIEASRFRSYWKLLSHSLGFALPASETRKHRQYYGLGTGEGPILLDTSCERRILRY